MRHHFFIQKQHNNQTSCLQVSRCSKYLGDDLRDVFQWLFDWIFSHVPLKSCNISDQVNCKWGKKTDIVIRINHFYISFIVWWLFFLFLIALLWHSLSTTSFPWCPPAVEESVELMVITSISKQVLLDFVSAVLQNISHVLSDLLHHTETQHGMRTGVKEFCFTTTLMSGVSHTEGILRFTNCYNEQVEVDLSNSELYLSTKVSSLASSSDRPTKTSSVPTC